MNRLRSLLHDYYPQALQAFPNLAHRAAASVLRAAPTPQTAQRLTPSRVVALLKQAERRNDDGLAEKISTTLHAPALRQPTPVEHTLGVAAVGPIDVITAMSNAIAAGSRARHRVRPTSAGSSHRQPAGPGTRARRPGPGQTRRRPTPVHRHRRAAQLRRHRAITRASGRSRIVTSGRICNRRLGDACHWWGFAAIT